MAGFVPGHIKHVPAEVLPVIIAGLVREGVTFNATPEGDAAKTFNVELTGGH